jgi:hypothetical protein
MDQNINIPLGLPNVRVLGMTKTEKGEWLIRVESTLTETRCRKCDQNQRITGVEKKGKALSGRVMASILSPRASIGRTPCNRFNAAKTLRTGIRGGHRDYNRKFRKPLSQ